MAGTIQNPWFSNFDEIYNAYSRLLLEERVISLFEYHIGPRDEDYDPQLQRDSIFLLTAVQRAPLEVIKQLITDFEKKYSVKIAQTRLGQYMFYLALQGGQLETLQFFTDNQYRYDYTLAMDLEDKFTEILEPFVSCFKAVAITPELLTKIATQIEKINQQHQLFSTAEPYSLYFSYLKVQGKSLWFWAIDFMDDLKFVETVFQVGQSIDFSAVRTTTYDQDSQTITYKSPLALLMEKEPTTEVITLFKKMVVASEDLTNCFRTKHSSASSKHPYTFNTSISVLNYALAHVTPKNISTVCTLIELFHLKKVVKLFQQLKPDSFDKLIGFLWNQGHLMNILEKNCVKNNSDNNNFACKDELFINGFKKSLEGKTFETAEQWFEELKAFQEKNSQMRLSSDLTKQISNISTLMTCQKTADKELQKNDGFQLQF